MSAGRPMRPICAVVSMTHRILEKAGELMMQPYMSLPGAISAVQFVLGNGDFVSLAGDAAQRMLPGLKEPVPCLASIEAPTPNHMCWFRKRMTIQESLLLSVGGV